MASHPAKKIVIVGGSLAGLFAGIILTRVGHNVTILERTPANLLSDQGAGISLAIINPPIFESLKKLGTSGAPISDFLAEYDRTKTPILESTGLQYLSRDGSIKFKVPTPPDLKGAVASWDLLYNILRANFDGVYDEGYIGAAEKLEGDGEATYLDGVTVTEIQEVGDDLVRVDFVDIDGKEETLEADVVIGADGPSSTVRKLLLPEAERTYAGYVAWRGTVRETLLSETTDALVGSVANISHSRGIQTVTYKIPGLKGSIAEGDKLANLVWYVNADKTQLQKILTDAAGVEHTYSLGVGKIDAEVKEAQRIIAAETLPPPIAEIFQKIDAPFIQAITDSVASKAVFMNGKVLLIGDALAGLRPHTTAGTSQAAMNALLLKKVFEKEGGIGIEEWERIVVGWGTFAQKLGVQMGNLSQFGEHPMADNGESPKL